MDHVSDSFLETNVPLLVLIEAAKNGNEKEVKEYAQVFREHANKLIEVANLACSISNNEEGVKLVRMSASQLEALCPQVINAALALAAKPQSKLAQENMDLFKEQWEKQVRVLTDAVDDITSIDDFLAVSENHILEDVNKCVIALQEKDVDGLDRPQAPFEDVLLESFMWSLPKWITTNRESTPRRCWKPRSYCPTQLCRGLLSKWKLLWKR